jgi:N-carbamoylputrescine amidase
MSRVVRAAMTETRNAYGDMPSDVADLPALAGRLDAVREANIGHHLSLIADAAERGVQILGMGELFGAPYFALGRDPMWRALAEDAESGPTITAMREAAAAHAMILIAPIYERAAVNGTGEPRRFNTAVVIDETGAILGKYRKTHIPQGENEQGAFHETFYYAASDGDLGNGAADVSSNPFFPVFETRLGRVGVAICYDRHFPGAIRSLAENRAELVFSPAVTFGAKSEHMWELEFEVDAARHNVYIGGSNRRGVEPPWSQPYFGNSYFVGPNGRPARMDSRPELIIADLDLGALSGPDPSGWNFARDRRPDIYS